MDGDGLSLADIDPAYKKVGKWKLKKLEQYYDKERGLVSAIRSTVRRLEEMHADYISKASELVGQDVTAESINTYIADMKDMSRLVELQTLEQFIITTVKDINAEMKRLHHHERISEMLLKEIKDKSI